MSTPKSSKDKRLAFIIFLCLFILFAGVFTYEYFDKQQRIEDNNRRTQEYKMRCQEYVNTVKNLTFDIYPNITVEQGFEKYAMMNYNQNVTWSGSEFEGSKCVEASFGPYCIYFETLNSSDRFEFTAVYCNDYFLSAQEADQFINEVFSSY